MGIPVLVLGESGSGKSSSLRNFDIAEVGIINVAGKPLPFRKKLNSVTCDNYETIKSILCKNAINTYVIDDSQYLMAFELFNRARENGYGKFTDIALNFKGLIDTVIHKTSADTIVYFLHHIETDNQNGRTKAKTIGKMLDDKLTVEGLFSIVLEAQVKDKKYLFATRNSGVNTVKTPMEMFATEYIDNDLKMVTQSIREYWGLNNTTKGAKSR